MASANTASREAGARPSASGSSGSGGMRRGIPLFRLAGIRIRLDYSWLLIFALVWWSLSAGYFPNVSPEAPAWATWLAGLASTLLFFLSVLAHELSHSLMALRAGIEVPSITLFLFGGASEMEDEPDSAGSELAIAAVGPLTSLGLGAIFLAGAWLLPETAPPLAAGVVEYLGWINLALGVFNLLPGLPLDGGRVLRALVWWRTGSRTRASQAASDAGKGLAVGIMVLGGIQIFAGGLVGGLWLVLIGLFIRGLAGAERTQMWLRRALEQVTVGEVMTRDVVTVPAHVTVRELVEDYLLRLGHRGFPVVENGSPVGVVSVEDVKDVAPEDRDRVTVRECMIPADDRVLPPDESLWHALRTLERTGAGRMLVLGASGELQGMLTKAGLLRFLQLRQALGET